MANEHPFQNLFETLGRLPLAHAESVNRHAYEILYDILDVAVEKTGRCILLRAPRAGHGKTHLLSRIQHHLGSSHEFIPLHASFGCQIDASTVIDDSLRRLVRPLPASGGLCVLDLVTRRLFSTALQPLVGSGEVPCQDREGALTALRTRPIETFDFHHPNAVTAHWARENFEVLGQRLSVELSQRCGLPAREVSFWVDTLFRFAATPVENPVRLRVLADAVHAGNPADGVLMERLEALLGMLALLMRVVLVADDLEGFSTDESAALRLAAFLGELRQSVERLDVILSLNQDIWQSAFVPRLSGGLADRLSEVVVELSPLSEEEMVALLESRVPGLGARVLSRMDRNAAGTHARGLIRAAGLAWLRASAMDSQVSAPPVSVPSTATELAPALPEAPPVAVPVPVPAPTPVFVAAPQAVEEVPVLEAPVPDVETAAVVADPVVSPPVFAVEPPAPVMAETPPITPPAPPVLVTEPPVLAPEPPVLVPEPPVAPVERAPDPTLAIAFLAASAKEAETSEVWPVPETSFTPPAPPVLDISPPAPAEVFTPSFEEAKTPIQAAVEAALRAETGVPFESGTFQPAQVISTPAENPFVASPEPPLLEPKPVSAFQPMDEPPPIPTFAAFEPSPPAFQPAFENPAQPEIQTVQEIAPPVPEFFPAPAPAFQPAFEPPPPPMMEPGTAFQPAASDENSAVPDTDRVDDLLRQFRERYGRGSM